MSGTEWRISEEAGDVRLDKYLAGAARLGSRGRAIAALERGKVFVNGVEASIADAARKLVAGDVVRLWLDRPGSAKRRPRTGPVGDLDIVYEDDSLIVVNKPAGLLTVPLERNPGVPSVYDQIERRLRSHGKRRPLPVHRIDQDSSGLVVFAKTPGVQRALKDQFKRREPARLYWAVVYGIPDPPEGTWRDFVVWDERSLVQKETHPKDPRATEAVSALRTDRSLSASVADRGQPAHWPAQSDPAPGATSRAHASGRGPLYLRSGHAPADRLWPSGAARASFDNSSSDRRSAARSRRRLCRPIFSIC